MEEMAQHIKFGKVEDLYEAASTYTGRKICQLRDHSFHIHMEEYIYARLAPVQLKRKVFHKDAANTPWLQGEKTQLRGVIQSLAWVAREARPDAAAAASVLASTFPEASVADIFDTNVMVRHLKQVPIRLTVHSIPEKDVRHVLIADAAFDTSGQAKSQHGWLQGYTDPSLNAGRLVPITLNQWRSKRLRRKASSSMLCEALSCQQPPHPWRSKWPCGTP